MIQQTQTIKDDFKKLLLSSEFTRIPQVGDIIKGKVLSLGKKEVWVDIEGFKTGVVRGVDVSDLKTLYPDLKIGDEVEATVLEIENENGEAELSFRFTGEKRVWEELEKLKQESQTIIVKIFDANRGGLMAMTDHQIIGFIPVSQLSPEHYPRVPGGDKAKILEKLREFIGKNMRVRILNTDGKEKKLIFSEKVVWEEEQKELLAKYKVGDIVEGKVTALADFGAFVTFSTERGPTLAGDELEGLVHISEIAWQRLDHPGDILKIGDNIKAKIIGIEGSKIFLSMKTLILDPWQKVHERYQIGQKTTGKILKVNPFGLFVELDPEIHGLAHVSELELSPDEKIETKIKPGDELEFKIVSIDPETHRLGLSQKALKEKSITSSIEPATSPSDPKPSS